MLTEARRGPAARHAQLPRHTAASGPLSPSAAPSSPSPVAEAAMATRFPPSPPPHPRP